MSAKDLFRIDTDRLRLRGAARRKEPSAIETISLNEATPEPPEKEAMRCFNSIWPKLQRTLRTRQSLLLFIDLLKSHYECGETTDRAIVGLTPVAPASPPSLSENSFDVAETGVLSVAHADEQAI